MRAEEFEAMRRRMLAEISAHAVQLRETIGKSAFDRQVMAAMEKVPRHEFVPIEFQAYDAPFNKVIVTAAPDLIPPLLLGPTTITIGNLELNVGTALSLEP